MKTQPIETTTLVKAGVTKKCIRCKKDKAIDDYLTNHTATRHTATRHTERRTTATRRTGRYTKSCIKCREYMKLKVKASRPTKELKKKYNKSYREKHREIIRLNDRNNDRKEYMKSYYKKRKTLFNESIEKKQGLTFKS